jgi:hypothetical protein
MPFDIRYWSQVSAAGNTTHVTSNTSPILSNSGVGVYSYKNTVDDMAVVLAANYFSVVAQFLKLGDIIQIMDQTGADPMLVTTAVATLNYTLKTITILQQGGDGAQVTNPTGGVLNDVPVFSDNTGRVLKNSGMHLRPTTLLSTHITRALRLGVPAILLTPGLEITDVSAIDFGPGGVGSLFVGGLQAMQFIDNDFGPDSQVCTLITGGLPSSSTSPSALLELQSTEGVFVPSRMTTIDIGNLTAPPDGAFVYDTTLGKGKIKESGVWNLLSDGSGTLTSLTPGTGISMTPNPITTTGTISNSGVLSVSGTGGQINATAGQNPVLSLPNVGTAGTYTFIAELITDTQGRVSSVTSGSAPVSGVLSVSGSAGRVTSSGGATPVIDLDLTTGLAGTYAFPSEVIVDNYRRVTSITAGSAPTPPNLSAKYILQEADAGLPNSQSIGLLASGILYNDVTTGVGVLRRAVAGSDYASVASVVGAQTTANAALDLATLANTTAASAALAAAAASTQASTAQTTANLGLGLATSLALAAYITKSDVGLLPNSQSLSSLVGGTGVLKTTLGGTPPTEFGTLSIAAAGTDYAGPAAKYLLQQASSQATQGQSLGLLTTGLMLNTVTGTTGVVSSAVPGTDYMDATPKVIVQEVNSSAPNAQSLGLLTTGLVKNTVTGAAGVLSTATAGTDYATPTSVSDVAGATFITQTPSTYLSGEQALSILATGIMKSTTATGVVSIAAAGTDYYAPDFPTVIQDGHGTASENLALGKNAGLVWAGTTNNSAIGIRSMLQLATGDGNTGIGTESGGPRTSATNCTWLGYLARNSVDGLTNTTAVGAGAQVGVSNAVSLGYQCFVGINNISPAYALDIKTGGGGPDALICLQTASVPAAPSANDGIYSVNSAKPKFTSGTSPWSGTLATLRTTGSDATCGTFTLNGSTPIVVNTTALASASSLLFVNYASSPANAGFLYVPVRTNGVGFQAASSNALDSNIANWFILNP